MREEDTLDFNDEEIQFLNLLNFENVINGELTTVAMNDNFSLDRDHTLPTVIDNNFTDGGIDIDQYDALTLLHGRSMNGELTTEDMADNYFSFGNTIKNWTEVAHNSKGGEETSAGNQHILIGANNLLQLFGHSHFWNITNGFMKDNTLVDSMAPFLCHEVTCFAADKKTSDGKQSLVNPIHYTKGKKCQAPNCNKLARQGGVCVRHGAMVKTCTFTSGCSNQAVKAGVCTKHGAVRNNRKCRLLDCSKEAKKGGICYMHGAQREKCSIHECTNVVVRGGACNKHCK